MSQLVICIYFVLEDFKESNNYLKDENLILRQKLETADKSNSKVNRLKVFK